MKKLLLTILLVLGFISPARGTLIFDTDKFTQARIEFSDVASNGMDTHSYFDGTYIWFPVSHATRESNAYLTGASLIRYNPDTKVKTAYALPKNPATETESMVYQTAGDNTNVYVYAPYGDNKTFYIFNKATAAITPYDVSAIIGGNGGKMCKLGNFVWLTGFSKFGKINLSDGTVTTYDLGHGVGTTAYPYGICTDGVHLYVGLIWGGIMRINPADPEGDHDLFPTSDGDAGGIDVVYSNGFVYSGTYMDSAPAGTLRLLKMDVSDGSVTYLALANAYPTTNGCGLNAIPMTAYIGGYVWCIIENHCSYSQVVDEGRSPTQIAIRINPDFAAAEYDVINPNFSGQYESTSITYDAHGNVYVSGYNLIGLDFKIVKLTEILMNVSGGHINGTGNKGGWSSKCSGKYGG
jgi:hypothetical protein